jgi:hypothetical protein
MASGYRFGYQKTKPNRFNEKMKTESVVVLLDADVAEVFKTTEQGNNALRTLISTMPAEKTKILTNLYVKLRISNSTEAVKRGIELGLISLIKNVECKNSVFAFRKQNFRPLSFCLFISFFCETKRAG